MILKKQIKALGTGLFTLNSTYAEGLYQMRAFPVWNKNLIMVLTFSVPQKKVIFVFMTGERQIIKAFFVNAKRTSVMMN
jgi:hypothetical protein